MGPLLEQVVILEEAVVAVAGVRDYQYLHRQGVLLHQIGDAGVRIDDDFVGEPLHALAVALLVGDEILAEGPVRIAHRQAGGRIRVEHLLGGDYLDLVGIGVEAVVIGMRRDRPVEILEQLEIPLGAGADVLVHADCFLNRPANTG